MTNYLKRIALVAVVSMAGVGIVTADQWDKKTTITTDEAMQLPNMMLQPGTYVIRLVDSKSNRHVVQFFDKDEKHLITTILAIPNERLRATGKSVFAFWEVPAGQPKALRAWFYPGDNFGQEFAYPKDEAARITASNKGATVPISDEKPEDLSKSAEKDTAAVTEPAPAPAPVATAEPAPAPAPAEVAAAPQRAPEPPAVTPIETPNTASARTADQDDAQRVAAQTSASDKLPQTASNLPLFALIGLLSLVGALALNFAYHRS